MPTRRQERVSERIHEEISALLQREMGDPRLANVTVTGVEVSPDLKMASIFISALGDREARAAALQGLQHASSYVRWQLAQRIQLRYTPELLFELDESWQRGARIDELLEQVQNDDALEESPGAEPEDASSSG
jgi:ribosome-binding factor A